MKNIVSKESNQSPEIQSVYVPFVNEECGDTMWDQVLKEAAERDAATLKPATVSLH